MQGFTQQSRMHPAATNAMNAGTGGMHRPSPAARPSTGRPQAQQIRPARGPLTFQQLLQQYLERMQGGR